MSPTPFIAGEQAVFGTGGIDLSRLPPPTIIKTISFDEIKRDMVAKFETLMQQEFPGFVVGDTDPAMRIIEVAAYREMLLRQQINDAARECMLAFATGTNLEHIAGLFNVKREELSEIDPQTFKNKMESDRSLRSRSLLSPERFSTAGAFAAYIYQAKKVGTALGLQDAYAWSPKAGEVHVTLLFKDHSDAKLIEKNTGIVAKHLNAKDVKPLTDILTVRPATVRDVVVQANIFVPHGVDADIIRSRAVESLTSYSAELYRVRADVPVSGLHNALWVPNVSKVVLLNFPADLIIGELQASNIIVDKSKLEIMPMDF